MKTFYLLILSCLVLCAADKKARTYDVQEYCLGNGHSVSLVLATLTNVPAPVCRAVVRVPGQGNKEYGVYVLKELPASIKTCNLKQYALEPVTNAGQFIYYRLTKTDKKQK